MVKTIKEIKKHLDENIEVLSHNPTGDDLARRGVFIEIRDWIKEVK